MVGPHIFVVELSPLSFLKFEMGRSEGYSFALTSLLAENVLFYASRFVTPLAVPERNLFHFCNSEYGFSETVVF